MERPIPEMTENVNDLVNQVRAIIDGYQADGEVKIVVDVLTMPAIFTLHVPLPARRLRSHIPRDDVD